MEERNESQSTEDRKDDDDDDGEDEDEGEDEGEGEDESDGEKDDKLTPVSGTLDDNLSAYEQSREKNIQANNLLLSQLGLKDVSAQLKESKESGEKKKGGSSKKAKGKEPEVRRVSTRIVEWVFGRI